jgi:hypothetical protein
MTRSAKAGRFVMGAAGIAGGLAILAACGGGSSSGSTSSSSSTVPSSNASGSNRAGGGFGEMSTFFQQANVKACLSAAGLTVPTFTRPSGAPSGGFPSGQRPSGYPSGGFGSGRPSGYPSGGFPSGARPSGARGFGRQNSADFQKIQQALTACGLTLPTFGRNGQSAAPQPSASASS